MATELVLPANHLLKPVDLGAVAGCGHTTISVRRKPRVAVIPTGTELVTVEQAAENGLKAGDIIEYKALVLAALFLSRFLRQCPPAPELPIGAVLELANLELDLHCGYFRIAHGVRHQAASHHHVQRAQIAEGRGADLVAERLGRSVAHQIEPQFSARALGARIHLPRGRLPP